MLTLQEIQNKIKQSLSEYEPSDPDMYVIVVDGERVALRSGKYYWESKHAAKCALTNHRKSVISQHMMYYVEYKKHYKNSVIRMLFENQWKEFIKDHIQIMTMREYYEQKEKNKAKKDKKLGSC